MCRIVGSHFNILCKQPVVVFIFRWLAAGVEHRSERVRGKTWCSFLKASSPFSCWVRHCSFLALLMGYSLLGGRSKETIGEETLVSFLASTSSYAVAIPQATLMSRGGLDF